MATKSLSQAQLDTINGITPRGFHLNSGTPCGCGADAEHRTTKSVGYSDFATYTHACKVCGNTFETYIEG